MTEILGYVTVQAVPMDDKVALECSQCGPFDLVEIEAATATVGAHLEAHGCDLEQTVVTRSEDHPA